jgi:hypothetical protein
MEWKTDTTNAHPDETVFVCLDYYDDGSNFEDDSDTDFAGGRSG